MEKLNYEAPLARDLSGLGATGQGPLYPCTAGLIANSGTDDLCNSGAVPDTCSTGMFFDAPTPCTSGISPGSGECVSGTGAANQTCSSGVAL